MPALHTPIQAAQWLRDCVKGQLHIDSRKVQQGDGFFAWPGLVHDARDYVAQALTRGASACLVEAVGADAFSWVEDENKVGVFTGLKQACGPIADAYFESPSQQLQMLAVTGTNGKTSTAWWLTHALNRAGQRCKLIGTLGMGDAQGLETTGLTTPDPVRLHAQLREWVEEGVKACAIEASSIGLKEHRLDGTRLRVAIFTNFTQDHLDYHGTMDEYWQAKQALFSWPDLQTAVINIDDPQGSALAQQLQSNRTDGALDIWTVSMRQTARLQARAIHMGKSGLNFEVVEGQEIISMPTQGIGEFNVLNLLGVVATMRALGLSLADAVKACQDLPSVPGRMQSMGDEHTPLVVIDYAHTPDALSQVLKALRPMARARQGQLHCVFGCGGNRDASKRAPMASAAEAVADHLVFTSDNPRNEDPQHIIERMLTGLRDTQQPTICIDRGQAIAQTIANASQRDVILVAGKGHETHQLIGDAKLEFSDYQHSLSALRLRGLA